MERLSSKWHLRCPMIAGMLILSMNATPVHSSEPSTGDSRIRPIVGARGGAAFMLGELGIRSSPGAVFAVDAGFVLSEIVALELSLQYLPLNIEGGSPHLIASSFGARLLTELSVLQVEPRLGIGWQFFSERCGDSPFEDVCYDSTAVAATLGLRIGVEVVDQISLGVETELSYLFRQRRRAWVGVALALRYSF